ncbi:MAG: HEAT repeat domain-containing protein [Chloroflexi bacterium]|nr:HEAT repeat domain-containing protein [Chloroflexota bacterium]
MPHTLDSWVRALRAGDTLAKIAAADALAALGAPAVPALLETLGSGDAETRWRAAAALGWIDDSRSSAPLLALLHESDWSLRHSALWALAMKRDASISAGLFAVLLDASSEEQIRYLAAMGLAHQQQDALTNRLRALAQDDNELLRRPANAALINPAFRPE